MLWCCALDSQVRRAHDKLCPRRLGQTNVRTKSVYCRINNLVPQQIKGGSNVPLWFFATDEHKLVERKLCELLSLTWNRVQGPHMTSPSSRRRTACWRFAAIPSATRLGSIRRLWQKLLEVNPRACLS